MIKIETFYKIFMYFNAVLQIKETKGCLDCHIHFWLGKETSQVRNAL